MAFDTLVRSPFRRDGQGHVARGRARLCGFSSTLDSSPSRIPGKILSSYRCPIAFHQLSVSGAVVGLSVFNLRTQTRHGITQRSAFQKDRHCHSHPQPRSGSPCGRVLYHSGVRDPGKVSLPEGWAVAWQKSKAAWQNSKGAWQNSKGVWQKSNAAGQEPKMAMRESKAAELKSKAAREKSKAARHKSKAARQRVKRGLAEVKRGLAELKRGLAELKASRNGLKDGRSRVQASSK